MYKHKVKFACPHCREDLRLSLPEECALHIYEHSLVPSLGSICKHIPQASWDSKTLIVSQLLHFDFDIMFAASNFRKVDENLFEFLRMSRVEERRDSLDSAKKQEIYEDAYLPIRKLEKEYDLVRNRIDSISTTHKEYKGLYKRKKEVWVH